MTEDPTVEQKIKEIFADEPEPEPAPAPEAAAAEVATEVEKPRDPRAKWFVIHTYSGYENKVRTNLERRTQSMRSQGEEKILQVLVPTEKEKEIKGGKRREVDRKIYPGYVLVEMIMEDDSWYVVRNTPGVTGFVGSGARPVPLEDQEVKKLLKQLRDETPKYRITFQKGSQVLITCGPFMEFCKAYNERTASMVGTIVPVEIMVYADRTFSFVTKTPPASVLLRQAAGIEKGSGEPNKTKVGKITRAQVRDIATQKMRDLNANDVDAAMRMVEGTARSMGIQIVG